MTDMRGTLIDIVAGLIVAFIVNVFISTSGLVNTSTTGGSLIATLVPLLIAVAVIFAALRAGFGHRS